MHGEKQDHPGDLENSIKNREAPNGTGKVSTSVEVNVKTCYKMNLFKI